MLILNFPRAACSFKNCLDKNEQPVAIARIREIFVAAYCLEIDTHRQPDGTEPKIKAAYKLRIA